MKPSCPHAPIATRLLPQNPAHHPVSLPSRLDQPHGLLQPARPWRALPEHSAHALGLPRTRVQTRSHARNRPVLQPQPPIPARVVRVALHPKCLLWRSRRAGIVPIARTRTNRIRDRRQRASPKQQSIPIRHMPLLSPLPTKHNKLTHKTPPYHYPKPSSPSHSPHPPKPPPKPPQQQQPKPPPRKPPSSTPADPAVSPRHHPTAHPRACPPSLGNYYHRAHHGH